MAEEHMKAVVRGNGEFTRNLYSILARESGNIFFSPISIHAILSLLYQGARGRTREAFAKILRVPDVKVAALGYKDVMSRLNAIRKVTLLIANKVFLREDYELQEAFNTVAVQQFSSEVELLNFKEPEVAASSINTWVENKTNNKIKDIFNPADLTDDTALVLVNAIYFKGKWAHPFDVLDTRIEKFYLNDVDTVHVQMMHLTEEFFYKEDASLNAKVLQLPYINKNISLIVVLPNKRNGIVEFEEKLAGTDITRLIENMYNQEVEVTLPKFKIEQTIDLKGPLIELGLGVIFRDDAEFSEMIKTRNNLCVSKAIQKTFIEVNEEGTEAAAATGVVVRECCMPPPPRMFTADHPFFIMLRFCQDGNNPFSMIHRSCQEGASTVLFEGRISRPQY